MSILDGIILGIVEGITEFLPISSTGHLMLAGRLLGMEQTEFLKSFEIAVQLGAICAVVVLYGRRVAASRKIWKRVLVAFLPTACIGALLYKVIKTFLLSDYRVVLWSLLVGGILLVLFEVFYREREAALDDIAALSYPVCVYIGIFQSIAMVPGVSRAAATIIGGLALGIKRRAIVEFSFLLAVPTMLAATGFDLLHTAARFSAGEFLVLGIGLCVSFLVAVVSIKFLLYFIKRHNFIPFGIYRMAAAAILWFILR